MSSAITTHPIMVGRRWRERPYLLSPFTDFMAAGGFAIIIFALFSFVVPLGSQEITPLIIAIAIIASYGSTVFNGSHFFASYEILYRGYGKKLSRFRTIPSLHLRYVLAGIIVPVFFLFYFGYVLAANDTHLFAAALNAMLVLVGWHYAKQSFGIFIMLSSMKKIFYSALQRRLLLINTYIVWGTYTFLIFTTDSPGIAVTRTLLKEYYERVHFDVPPILISLVLALCALSTLVTLIVIWQKKSPSLSGFVGYLTMYLFLLGVIVTPAWLAFIGPLHGVQYWLFVYAYKRGQGYVAPAANPRVDARVYAPVFFLIAVLFSVTALEMVPVYLEGWLHANINPVLPFAYALNIAMSIQHFFIDNAIWRREHTEIPQYLFHEPQPA